MKKIKKTAEQEKIILQFKMEVPAISDAEIANLMDQIKTKVCWFFTETEEQRKLDSKYIPIDLNQVFPEREIFRDVLFSINPKVSVQCPFCKKKHIEKLWFDITNIIEEKVKKELELRKNE